MKTEMLNDFELQRAKKILLKGEIIAFPTETVYGLGIVYDDELAFQKLCDVKKRPNDKPYTLMCASYEVIEQVAIVDTRAKSIIEHFMPGEITLLLPVKNGVPHWVTLGSNKIGVRIPNCSITLNLLKEVGKPLLVPSANKSGESPALTSEDVIKVFDEEIAGVILGKANNGKPSTIVDLTEENIKLIREGNVSFEEILKIWEETKL